MSHQRKTRLKSKSFSYKERGRLSERKDLDVAYVTHQKREGKKRKTFWLEASADPSYEISQEEESSSKCSSPRKIKKINPEELERIPEDFDRELHGDFSSQNMRRQTKAGPSNERDSALLTRLK